ncbi:Spx/MgsR family RNA polymerase-binding regulatory protein [Mesobacillus subterraneus]|uniref:Spx/MgsR family RNA polymerase-binding regulatory protein n=1 Tax=Mesobacillus subterraneus TaxID=285983 RepID=A0A427TWC0_9BACI|nr:Spx/MgsR family RNA polymerase-binding regulatory protein [Mesobacillus subterraneus]RSD28465.1 Spx/MgsR family RNA polymerase-binding regulatory protein [Mesobacillus subterraneus]
MTVTIYGLGCRSTKKARQWMVNNQIPFVERNLVEDPLTVLELQELLKLTTDGTDDIISKRSLPYRTMNLDLDTLSLHELLEIVHRHPRLLKSPLIVENKKLQVGYNEEEIRQFLPRKVRKFQWLQWKIEHLQPLEY